MKNREFTFQIKGCDKSLEKQLNEVKQQTSRKRIQNSDTKDNPGSQKKNGDDAKDLGEQKNKRG